MANPYYLRPASVVPGTTIRADKYNSDLDVIESSFDTLDEKLQQAVFLPSTFSGNPVIPEQTVTNTFIYIDEVGDIGLYPIQTFLDQFAQVTAQYNQIDSWRQQVSSNAIDAQNHATKARDYANADKNIEVDTGEYSGKHYSLIAKDWADAAEAIFDGVQSASQQAQDSAQDADALANYTHNQTIPDSGGKYSAYHWAKESQSYASQAQAIVGGNFVPSTRTVNGKTLDANIILNFSDVQAVPVTSTVNGYTLTDSITLDHTDVGALPDTTNLSTLGGVPTTRTVNGKALNSDISLNFNDVGALPSTTTLNTLGGVPTSRQVNGKALTDNITLDHTDVGGLPSSYRATSVTEVSSSFTATKSAELTQYALTTEADTTVTVDSSAFSDGDILLIDKSRQTGALTLNSGANMIAPNGVAESSHNIPSGYDCTIKLLFGANGIANLRVY